MDHFFPAADYPLLAFAWANLYPACYTCNSTHKGTRCIPSAARPDIDPVESWFEIDASTGELEPAKELGATEAKKVEDAIELFGLNESGRPEARKRTIRAVTNAVSRSDDDEIKTLRDEGLYVFVIDAVVRSRSFA